MLISKTSIDGVFIIEPELHADARGYFARIWCEDEFKRFGLKSNFTQSSISSNTRSGTLRGMHLQKDPYGEHKLIHVIRGKIFDVLLDLRKDSKTYKKWISFELESSHRQMIYISPGIAHGFQTLADHTEIEYNMVERYRPEFAMGVRYNDPEFNIIWPLTIPADGISDKDMSYPPFNSLS